MHNAGMGVIFFGGGEGGVGVALFYTIREPYFRLPLSDCFSLSLYHFLSSSGASSLLADSAAHRLTMLKALFHRFHSVLVIT